MGASAHSRVQRNRIFVASVLLLVSLGIRLPVTIHPLYYAPDTSFYVALAPCFDRLLLTGRFVDEWSGAQLDKWIPPFYPLHIAVARWLVKDPFEAAKWVSFVSGSLVPVLTFAVALLIFDSTFYAGVSAFLVAVLPHLIELSGLALTESTFLVYFLLMIGCYYLAVTRKTIGWWIVLGIITGFVHLTRPSGLFYIPLLVFWTIVFGLANAWSWRRVIAYVLLLVCSFVLIVLPYYIHLYQRWGAVTLAPLSGIRPLINLIYFSDNLHQTSEELRAVLPYLKSLYSFKIKVVAGEYNPLPYLNGSTDNWHPLDFALKHPGIILPMLANNFLGNLGHLHNLGLTLPRSHSARLGLHLFLIYVSLGVGLLRKKWTRLGMYKAGFLLSFVILQWFTYSYAYTVDRYMTVMHPIVILLIVGGGA